MLTAREILAWDTVNWSMCLRMWRKHMPARKLRCLELGCGPGSISLWLAHEGHDVVCTDLKEPGPAVRELHSRYGVSQSVTYQALDATAIPCESEFDVVITKSVLGGIWHYCGDAGIHRTVAGIHRALKPGGKWLFGENLEASALHMFGRRVVLGRAGKAWRYPRLDEFVNLAKPFGQLEYTTGGLLGTFGRAEWQRTTLGWLDKAVVPCVPRRWRYLMAAVATR